ncbi:37S ribosomal protein S9, mitochondrial [Irineochytrium annulatum]|nr:37S ribosomal protein S9, mitochondrial [Irineochytrium annulatum]
MIRRLPSPCVRRFTAGAAPTAGKKTGERPVSGGKPLGPGARRAPREPRASQTTSVTAPPPPIPGRPYDQKIVSISDRPMDIAYFTGNPQYYNLILRVNRLIQAHGLPFKDKRVYEGQTLPTWMTLEEMAAARMFKMTPLMYEDLIHKLNVLFTIQDKDAEVAAMLANYLRPGTALTVPKIEGRALDEFGRAHARGSRKTARAQCWVVEGDGQIFINGVQLADYFQNIENCEKVIYPLEAVGMLGRYNVWGVVVSGGTSGQAQAIAVAIARCLAIHEPLLEPTLGELGLTKIDRRQVERKKTGQPKARKKNSWVKR